MIRVKQKGGPSKYINMFLQFSGVIKLMTVLDTHPKYSE